MEKTETDKEIASATQAIAENAETLDQRFIRQIREFEINGHVFADRNQVFLIGHPSQALLDAGVPDLPIILTQVVVNKAIGNIKHKQDEGHEITCVHLELLPSCIQGPVVVIESVTQADSKLIYTELKDAKRETIIVVIRINGQVGRVKSNIIVSIHTRPNNQLSDLLTIASTRGEILYKDVDKIKNWLRQVGKLQLLSKL